jgi:leucyl-tRNA synthetase
MVGSRRFLERVWKLQSKVGAKCEDKEETLILLNQTIKKVGEDIESFNANTAISSMMILTKHFEDLEKISKKTYLDFIRILSPFAPHICEEIWMNFLKIKTQKGKKLLVLEKWPDFDPSKITSANAKIVVQINGKFRATIEVKQDSTEDVVEKEAVKNELVSKWLENKKIIKKIFVPNKIINFVISE